jgi:glycine oxidase
MPGHVVIVGAGLIGLFTAWYLRQAGVAVTLLDRGLAGREASWASAGMLTPVYPWRYPEPVWALVDWSLREYPGLVAHLRESTGVDAHFVRNGVLTLDQPDRTEALIWSREQAREISDWDVPALRNSTPGLGDHLNALYLPWAAQVQNRRLIRALVEALVAGGAVIREGAPVRELIFRDNRVVGVSIDGEVLHAQAVVVAAGAWSGALVGSQLHLPITPVKGQMLSLRGRRGMLRHILVYRGHYVIPRRDGYLLVGSTMERTGFAQETTATARAQLVSAAAAMIPALGNLPLSRHWAGLRPATPNGLPIISGHPHIEGLYFNTGHYLNGVATAPASGRLMADLVMENAPVLEPTSFAWLRDAFSS